MCIASDIVDKIKAIEDNSEAMQYVYRIITELKNIEAWILLDNILSLIRIKEFELPVLIAIVSESQAVKEHLPSFDGLVYNVNSKFQEYSDGRLSEESNIREKSVE